MMWAKLSLSMPVAVTINFAHLLWIGICLGICRHQLWWFIIVLPLSDCYFRRPRHCFRATQSSVCVECGEWRGAPHFIHSPTQSNTRLSLCICAKRKLILEQRRIGSLSGRNFRHHREHSMRLAIKYGINLCFFCFCCCRLFARVFTAQNLQLIFFLSFLRLIKNKQRKSNKLQSFTKMQFLQNATQNELHSRRLSITYTSPKQTAYTHTNGTYCSRWYGWPWKPRNKPYSTSTMAGAIQPKAISHRTKRCSEMNADTSTVCK